jgi:hypothetical protein
MSAAFSSCFRRVASKTPCAFSTARWPSHALLLPTCVFLGAFAFAIAGASVPFSRRELPSGLRPGRSSASDASVACGSSTCGLPSSNRPRPGELGRQLGVLLKGTTGADRAFQNDSRIPLLRKIDLFADAIGVDRDTLSSAFVRQSYDSADERVLLSFRFQQDGEEDSKRAAATRDGRCGVLAGGQEICELFVVSDPHAGLKS